MATQGKPNQNMALWDQVKTTDMNHTKVSSFEGRNITSINGMYVVMRATEVLGPIGKGWGFDILEDRIDQGAPITTGKSDDIRVIGHEQVHTILLKLWYLRAGRRSYITQYGHTPYVMKTSWGIKTDFDYAKKSLTDAMKKCLSLAGFCADVHLGMFDDPIYIQGLELKQRLEYAGEDEKSEVMKDVRGEFREWLDRQISAISLVPNERAIDLMSKAIIDQARAKAEVVKYDPNDIERRITEAAEQRKQWLIENPGTPAKPITKVNEA